MAETSISVCWALGRYSGIGEVLVSQEEIGSSTLCVCVCVYVQSGSLMVELNGGVSSRGHHQ